MIVSRTILVMARRGGGGLRYFSAAAREELGSIPLSYPAVIVWGSNTGVGKTLFSAGLAAAARRAGVSSLGKP
jgi:dethiobiotin synthetase/adenosylmethionine--8-amino-7-oxononanoate aminotransferase